MELELGLGIGPQRIGSTSRKVTVVTGGGSRVTEGTSCSEALFFDDPLIQTTRSLYRTEPWC
jgi:hypothetical protein